MSKSKKEWKGETVLIAKEMLSKHLAALQAIYYIAGPPPMVGRHAADAGEQMDRRGRHSGRRVCRLLRYRNSKLPWSTLS
jgi:NAD(P)H-flavin reductase